MRDQTSPSSLKACDMMGRHLGIVRFRVAAAVYHEASPHILTSSYLLSSHRLTRKAMSGRNRWIGDLVIAHVQSRRE